RDGTPGKRDDLHWMEGSAALGRVERRGAQPTRVGTGDGEALGCRPDALDEVAVHRLDPPEVGAIGQTKRGVLWLTTGRVLFDNRRETGRWADLPVIRDDSARVADRRP